MEPTPAPQPEPEVIQPDIEKPAPVPSDKVIAQKPAEGKKLAHTGATTDSSIAVAMASILGGLGLVAAARHTPRHRRGL
ncbi:LPXTG cell wall anchor domain-containing protein [Trueperella pyogenes]|uniref:LPXTG cell wall anchor domain-containing protein n=1 Tax=Trueperella pyogenes TaxID=1661 RepID=UPI003DA9054D